MEGEQSYHDPESPFVEEAEATIEEIVVENAPSISAEPIGSQGSPAQQPVVDSHSAKDVELGGEPVANQATPEGFASVSSPHPSQTDPPPTRDPPGWSIQAEETRQMSYGTSKQGMVSKGPVVKEAAEIVPPEVLQQRQKERDDYFNWVPTPMDSTRRDVRSRDAQHVFETTVPKRSWSIEEDDKGSLATTNNSWFPRAPAPLNAETNIENKAEDDEETIEEEIIEEEFSDEDEEVIEEFIDEEEEEVIDEEILEESIEEEEGETIEDDVFLEEIAIDGDALSRSSSSSTLSPSSVTSASKPFSSKRSKQNKGSKQKKPSLPPVREPTKSDASSSSSSSYSSARRGKNNRRGGRKKRPSKGRSQRHDNSSVGYSVSSESLSTQVIYIQDDSQLEGIIEGCEGAVVIEDDFQVVDKKFGVFVPSRGVLLIMVLVIVLVAQVIGIGLYFLARG